MKKTALKLKSETLRALTTADLGNVVAGIATANASAENVSCCSFDAPCPTEECPTRRGSCRFC